MATQVLRDLDATGVDRRVPAECVLASRDGQLLGADLRVYQFHSHQTNIPPLRDTAVIAWQTRAEIALRCGDISSRTQMSPWDFSILRPGFESNWRWNTSFKAVVLYINERRLARIASEVFDRDVESIIIRESFQLQDPVIQHGISSLATELRSDHFGGALYADALLTQLCVHMLRHHANARLKEPKCPGALSASQSRQIVDYIESNLAADLSLESLCGIAGMSQYHFARLFKKRFGIPPHAYIQQRRVERAHQLILNSDLALKEIVFSTGFYDQSHMTKSFKRTFDTTPTALRRASSGLRALPDSSPSAT